MEKENANLVEEFAALHVAHTGVREEQQLKVAVAISKFDGFAQHLDEQFALLKKDRQELDDKMNRWKQVLHSMEMERHQLEMDRMAFLQEQGKAEEQLMEDEAKLQEAWHKHEQELAAFNIQNDVIVKQAAAYQAHKEAMLENIRRAKKKCEQKTDEESSEEVMPKKKNRKTEPPPPKNPFSLTNVVH